MAFELSTLKTDTAAEVSGVWTPDAGNGFQLKLARIGNVEYTKEMAKIAATTNTLGGGDKLSDILNDPQKLAGVLAKTILKDWRGLDLGGQNMPYSYDNAVKAMVEYPDFQDYVIKEANKVEYWRTVRMEEDAGN